jgi:hypothetical protein
MQAWCAPCAWCADRVCPHQRFGGAKATVKQMQQPPASPGVRELDAAGITHPGRVYDERRQLWRAATEEELAQAVAAAEEKGEAASAGQGEPEP